MLGTGVAGILGDNGFVLTALSQEDMLKVPVTQWTDVIYVGGTAYL